MRSTCRVAWVIGALASAPLGAQAPDDAAILAQLDAAVSPEPLPDLPAVSDPEARQIQMGLEELAHFLREHNRNTLERALFRFNRAATRRPSWAWPEYGMARAFLLMHDLALPVIQSEGGRDGEPHLDAMWRHLLEALRRDPGMLRSRLLLADLAYSSGDRELRHDTREALAAEMSQRDPLPDALMVWARHVRAERRYEVALAILDRAERSGADRSVVALERARILAAVQRPATAVAAYWDGLRLLTPRGRDLYRQDLGWVVDGDSLRAFEDVPPGHELAWLRKFWGERDAAAVAEPDTRLGEHLRRWAYVHEVYRIPAPWRRNFYSRVDIAFDFLGDACVGNATAFYDRLPIHPPALTGDLRHRESLLDHRALIYMRHGEPFARTVPPRVLPDTTLEPSPFTPAPAGFVSRGGQEYARLIESIQDVESWVYWVEGGWRAFHFRGSDALGKHSATTLSSYLPVQSTQAWVALANILPAYQPAVAEMTRRQGTSMPCRKHVTPAIAQMRVDAAVGIESDSDTPRVLDPWNAVLRFFAIGDERDASGRVLLTFALPTDDLAGDTLPNGNLAWPVHLKVSAWRSDDGARVDLDTLRTFAATRAVPGALLSGLLELRLDNGHWNVAVIARQPGDSASGAYALRRGLVVGGATTLTLSDVVTGREGQPNWRAPDGPFPVNTLGAWVAGGTVELWYEIRGLLAGQDYRTTIEVIPTEQRLGEPIRVATTDGAPSATTQVRKSIGLERLRAGTYRLVVTVEQGDHRATREQDVLIVEGP
jgi:hypothetical protein